MAEWKVGDQAAVRVVLREFNRALADGAIPAGWEIDADGLEVGMGFEVTVEVDKLVPWRDVERVARLEAVVAAARGLYEPTEPPEYRECLYCHWPGDHQPDCEWRALQLALDALDETSDG